MWSKSREKYQIQSELHNELFTFYQILVMPYLQNNSHSISHFIKYHLDQLSSNLDFTKLWYFHQIFIVWFIWRVGNPETASKQYRTFPKQNLCNELNPKARLEICQKIYTTWFSGQKFYTLKVRKLQLFFTQKKQRKCINISYLSRLFVKI